jgi:hypothetical protein
MPNTRGSILRASLLTLALSSSSIAQRESTPVPRDTAFTWSKKLPDGARFAIRNLNGGIEIRPGSTDRVEVRAVIRNAAPNRVGDIGFDVREIAADDVEICTTDRGLSACVPEETATARWDERINVLITVDLPKGLRIRGTTGSGYVIVTQVGLEVDATTGGGDVVVRESLSRASATTGNGDVTVAMANGPVRATSGNGRVLVNTALGPVTASSGNGDVEVRMISVASNVAPLFTSVSSGNGDIRVTLPADFSGEIDASTGHHDIKSDFQVRTSSQRTKSQLRGTIGGGTGPLVKIHSGNGRVEIRKD